MKFYVKSNIYISTHCALLPILLLNVHDRIPSDEPHQSTHDNGLIREIGFQEMFYSPETNQLKKVMATN